MSSGKKKICWNCEGNVSIHEENCPYCAVYIGPAEPYEEEKIAPPPYQSVSESYAIPKAPYEIPERQNPSALEEEAPGGIKTTAITVALFSGGVIFALFGLILWLFSQNGVLTLSWNSSLWYFYVLLALPMLFFGWRQLEQLE